MKGMKTMLDTLATAVVHAVASAAHLIALVISPAGITPPY
jgi:hypothetical protein